MVILHVMAGHSCAKHGVASLAYVPAIHDLAKKRLGNKEDVDARMRGHDAGV
jgi:hypothetical protein